MSNLWSNRWTRKDKEGKRTREEGVLEVGFNCDVHGCSTYTLKVGLALTTGNLLGISAPFRSVFLCSRLLALTGTGRTSESLLVSFPADPDVGSIVVLVVSRRLSQLRTLVGWDALSVCYIFYQSTAFGAASYFEVIQ